MCELQWSALAEFHLYNSDFPEEIYCLCSRVFTWTNDNTNTELSASEEDILKQEDTTYLPENPCDEAQESSDTLKYCAKGEPVSCYCSASHTDNISTDEHDSLRDSHGSHNQSIVTKPLQLSDSGADLTEEIGCTKSAWQRYWSVNGERLIWKSWIAKYSAYINPDYLESIQAYSEGNCSQDLPNKEESTDTNLKLSFNSISPPQDYCDYSTSLGQGISLLQVKETTEQKPASEVVEKNRMLVRNLSYSDSYEKLNREIEGWNPLSPVSNDCETEAERLLSSRCASRTGSTARTVDSMTNVTRLTVSSFDLSESSKNSDSFSSVSSIQSSITSTSSEEADETTEYEQEWNVLWAKHYEDEYLEHYKRFILENCGKQLESMEEVSEDLNFDINEYPFENQTPSKPQEEITQSSIKEEFPKTYKKNKKRNTKPKQKGKKIGRSLEQSLESNYENESIQDSNTNQLVNRIYTEAIEKIENINKMEVDLPADFIENKVDKNKKCDSLISIEESTDDSLNDNKSAIETENQTDILDTIGNNEDDEDNSEEVEYVGYLDNEQEMLAMGVPLSFECSKFAKTNSRDFPKKRSYTHNSDEASSNRIKAAFTLLGMELEAPKEKRFIGSIEYKMKHIKFQNRGLQLRNDYHKSYQPKHIYFDDDGEAIAESGTENNEVTVQNTHQDELLGIHTNCSTEENDIPDQDEMDESINKKRKRKRKVNLPAEIKENSILKKFWYRRYSLFSKFDQGIKLDEESWFSVTPELVARHIAERCRCDVIVDAFCGAGGNAIQFASTCNKVIAIDIDPKKIELAKHNAQVYGVEDRIEFIIGDFFHLVDTLKADLVFLSPPWGGPQYMNTAVYDLEMLQPVPFDELFKSASKIAANMAFFLPKNSNTHPLVIAAGLGGKMEIEQNFLGKRLISITAYYGDVIKEASPQKRNEES